MQPLICLHSKDDEIFLKAYQQLTYLICHKVLCKILKWETFFGYFFPGKYLFVILGSKFTNAETRREIICLLSFLDRYFQNYAP